MQQQCIRVAIVGLCFAATSCGSSSHKPQVEPPTDGKVVSDQTTPQTTPQTKPERNFMLVDRKDMTPEDVVRIFMVATVTQNERQLKLVTIPADGLEILLQGESPSEEMKENFIARVESTPLRRLKLNETITVGGGNKVTMDSVRVNENRVQITTPGAPVPFDVLRAKNGLWWVNPEFVIAGRRAAKATMEKSAK